MDLPGIVATAGLASKTTGLVSSAIGAYKSVRELAKNVSDHELKEKIGAAYETLQDLRDHVLALDEENRTLKAQLTAKATYIGPVAPHGYYFAAADDQQEHPLCTSCFQHVPQQIGYMSEPEEWNGGMRRTCKKCSKTMYEKPMDLTPTRVQRTYDPYSRL